MEDATLDLKKSSQLSIFHISFNQKVKGSIKACLAFWAQIELQWFVDIISEVDYNNTLTQMFLVQYIKLFFFKVLTFSLWLSSHLATQMFSKIKKNHKRFRTEQNSRDFVFGEDLENKRYLEDILFSKSCQQTIN